MGDIQIRHMYHTVERSDLVLRGQSEKRSSMQRMTIITIMIVHVA